MVIQYSVPICSHWPSDIGRQCLYIYFLVHYLLEYSIHNLGPLLHSCLPTVIPKIVQTTLRLEIAQANHRRMKVRDTILLCQNDYIMDNLVIKIFYTL